MPGWGQGLKMAGEALKMTGKGMYKVMPKSVAGWVGTYVGYNVITGQGVDGAVKGALSPDMQQSLENGDGALKPIVNGVLGEKNIDAVKEDLHELKESAKEAAQSAREHTVDAYHSAKEAISEAMHSQATDVQGMSPGQMQQYQQMQQYAPYGQYGQNGNGLMDWFTGNGFNAMNSASLLGAAWLTFGRFSWMGKLMGILLGTWGTKNLLGNREMIQFQQQAYAQEYYRRLGNNDVVSAPTPQDNQNDKDRFVIRRR